MHARFARCPLHQHLTFEKKNPKITNTQNALRLFNILQILLNCIPEPVIDSVTPNEGSLCGETRLLISGRGFSQDNINEGNQVQLVSGTTSYDCPVSKDGTTELKVMCYTP